MKHPYSNYAIKLQPRDTRSGSDHYRVVPQVMEEGILLKRKLQSGGPQLVIVALKGVDLLSDLCHA